MDAGETLSAAPHLWCKGPCQCRNNCLNISNSHDLGLDTGSKIFDQMTLSSLDPFRKFAHPYVSQILKMMLAGVLLSLESHLPSEFWDSSEGSRYYQNFFFSSG